MRMLEIPVIMARLRTAWGIPSILDINSAISNCRREFVQSEHMDALFARHTANYRLLAQANQPVPDAIKIANAVEAFTPCASYNECMKTFEQRFAPGDPNRTFAAFKVAMLAFDRLTPRTTTGVMGYSAATISVPPQGFEARLRALEAHANIHDATGDVEDRLRALEGIAATTTPNLAARARPLLYCWSHGINHSHDSRACEHPKDKHKRGATMDNKLGGSLRSVTK